MTTLITILFTSSAFEIFIVALLALSWFFLQILWITIKSIFDFNTHKRHWQHGREFYQNIASKQPFWKGIKMTFQEAIRATKEESPSAKSG